MPTVSTPTVREERPSNANVVGTIPSAIAAYVTRVEECGNGAVRQTRVYVSGLPVTLTDNGSNGSGGVKFYDFPKGGICALGGGSKLTIAYGSVTDPNLIGSIGSTTAGADGTLATTEITFGASTTAATVSGVGTLAITPNPAIANLNGTGTAAGAFFNLATSSDPGTNNAVTVTGYLELTWINHGDITLA